MAPSFLPVSIVIEVSLQSIIDTSGFGGVLRLERVKTTLLVVEREREGVSFNHGSFVRVKIRLKFFRDLEGS